MVGVDCVARIRAYYEFILQILIENIDDETWKLPPVCTNR